MCFSLYCVLFGMIWHFAPCAEEAPQHVSWNVGHHPEQYAVRPEHTSECTIAKTYAVVKYILISGCHRLSKTHTSLVLTVQLQVLKCPTHWRKCKNKHLHKYIIYAVQYNFQILHNDKQHILKLNKGIMVDANWANIKRNTHLTKCHLKS